MLLELPMQEQKPGKKPSAAEKSYTTFRILEKDGEDLSELADKRGKTIAALYHELFSKTVRDLLIAETKERLKNLQERKD